MMEIIQEIIVTLSLIAAILAWIAKIKWSKEYKEAKEAQIDSLKQQIENWKALTPDKLREYYIKMKEQLEEFNDFLKSQLKEAEKEIDKKDKEIILLSNNEEKNRNKIEKVIKEKVELEEKVINIENKYSEIRVDHGVYIKIIDDEFDPMIENLSSLIELLDQRNKQILMDKLNRMNYSIKSEKIFSSDLKINTKLDHLDMRFIN